MDDSFAYRTTVPFRRRLDPWLVKLGAVVALVLVSIGLFANWVIASERRSFERSRPVHAEPVEPSAVSGLDVIEPTPADAEETLRRAAAAAGAAFATEGSFLAATPSRLGELQPGAHHGYGPSTAPDIVSVSATADAWAAAVLAPDGTCLWIGLSGDGTVNRAEGADCTGAAALASLAAR